MVNSGMRATRIISVAKSTGLAASATPSTIRSKTSRLPPAARPAIDAFQHHDRRVDENAEVDGADRNQIRRLIGEHHQAECKKHGEGNGNGGDERHAPVAQHAQQNQRDQRKPEDDDVADRGCGDVNQLGAVVDGADLHPGRQQIAVVERVDFLLQGGQRRKGLRAPLQQHDALHNVGVVVWLSCGRPCPGAVDGLR